MKKKGFLQNIDYSPYELDSDDVSQELLELIESEFGDELEIDDTGSIKIRNVESPFIIADNDFDLHEANNDLIEIGVKRSKVVSFSGGAFYIEYVKVEDTAVVVQGNREEGYNIFILK